MPGGSRTTHRADGPAADVDERALVAAAKSDRAAFGVLYDRYAARVYRYCFQRLQTPEQAEDATSLVFTKALAALSRYREDAPSFGAWLFAIAHNVVVDELRSGPKHASGEASPHVMTDPEPGPEHRAIAADAVRELRTALARLPVEQARLVELRLAGLTDKEIAFVLGKSHGAVRVAQHRAIQRLRAILGVNTAENADD